MSNKILRIWLIFCMVPISAFSMWHAVDPEDSTEIITYGYKGALLQKVMLNTVLHASELDVDSERAKIQKYCNKHGRQSIAASKWLITCPDSQCTSKLTSGKNKKQGLTSTLLAHWYTTARHQPDLHAYATALLAETHAEAKRKHKERKSFKVVSFPSDHEESEKQEPLLFEKKRDRNVADNEDEEIEESEHLQSEEPTRNVRAKLKASPERCFIVTPPLKEGIYDFYFADSREEVLQAYLNSKKIEGHLDAFKPIEEDLVLKTKKQCMVQGSIITSLVCPAQGCMYQVGAPNFESIVQELLVHYAAFHKQDSPCLQTLVGSIAPDFEQARKKIEQGN
ncbi:MAG: hypothetical protein AB7F19_00540 [Candidatus Babeliales bacterium]